MTFETFMEKIRQLDNLTAKWLMKHFYFLFFQIVLVVVFVFWFINIFRVIDITIQPDATAAEAMLASQTTFMGIMTLLLLLNSFWMLFLFNAFQRAMTILKDISFNINRLRFQKQNKNK